MNCLLFNNTSCSLKQTSTIVLFYKRLKGLLFRSHNAKFGLSRTWSQTPEDRFSHDEAHRSIRFDICSIIIQLKVDRKHTLIPFLY